MSMTITTNNHKILLQSYSEAIHFDKTFPSDDFDYIDEMGRYDARLFKYRGVWYDVDEFSPIGFFPGPDNLMSNKLKGWDDFQANTFFSGVAIKYFWTNDYDDGYVIAGTVYVS